MAYIKILDGAQAGVYFPLGARKATNIGRDPGMDLQLLDSAVSRRHCHLRRSETGEFFVSVLTASPNERPLVIVNGRAIDDEQGLENGDVIEIGDTSLRFTEGEAAGEDARYIYKDPRQRDTPTIKRTEDT